VFFTRPISAAFILLAVAVIISSYFRIKKTAQREQQNALPDRRYLNGLPTT
jgi:TctA family transporter